MPRFHSTLHVLCEEAKWGEVKQIVFSVVSLGNNTSHCDDDNDENNIDDSDWNQERLSEALLQQEGPHDWTPLMLSCVRAPLGVIAMLCHAQPKACLMPDKSGSLPIHFCASWRRGPFVDVLYKMLVDAKPESMQIENVWGQTPLHSLLGSKETPPIGALRIMLDQGEHSRAALQHTDRKKNLPLHIACHKHLPSEYIQALVEAYRDATFVTDGQGNLPCHILHNLGSVNPESMEAVLLPLALGTSRRTSSITTAKPNTMAQLVSLTKQVLSQHGKNSPPLIAPVTPAQVACQTYGHENMLPIHIAAHHAVKLEIIKGICRQYPAGVAIRIPWGNYDDTMEKKTSVRLEHDDETLVEQTTIPCIVEDTEFAGQNSNNVVPDDATLNENDTSAIEVPEIATVDSLIAVQGFSTQSPQVPSLRVMENDEPWEEESLNTSPESDSDNDEFAESNMIKPTDGASDGASDLSFSALCALEIFEHGRAGKEVEAAIHLQGDPLSGAKSQEVLVDFARRSDLLLSFAPEVVDPKTGNCYLDELDRLRRLERLIRKEARDSGAAPLSDTVSRVWSYIANYNSQPDSRKYIKSVGRIITNLPPSGLWKLTVVSMVDHDIIVQIMCTGRTIVQEAELRAPIARMDHMMKHYWFQYNLTSFLSPLDALNYSVTCRFTRAAGVRLLPQVPLRVTEASWQKPESSEKLSPPKPWQRLDVLVTEDCTHTIFVSYYVECTYVEESQVNDHHAFGGMIIVRDDNRKLRPNTDIPWGEAVVAYSEVPAVSGSLVRLSFPHTPGRSYGLWYYNRGEPGSKLNVSDVRIRQLLHSCDEQGRSPLHLLLSKMVDHTPNPRLNLNVSMLLAAKFGSGDSVGDVPLHYALKCGVSEDVLQAIITASPAALVDCDNQGRTPIHAAFLLSKDEPPRLGVIRALLTPPGENAIKLKDWSGRLPIHIAAERGAGGAILKLLVDAYQDGCYRTNDQGDLPLHLLLKSGLATASSVELLIRPMMSNESICRIGGSRGTNLPLHIAAEYQVSFKIIERLLQTFGEAAERTRVFPAVEGEVEEEPQFALDIVENARGKTTRNVQEEDSACTDDSFLKAKCAAISDFRNAEFLLRSDLIFVYNPLLINRVTRTPYRSDRERIRRLETMIQREAVQCGDERKINCKAKLSDMAKQGWLFLCTYSNPDDPLDNFAGTVRRILRGLSAHAVDVLAHVENPKSLPTANRMVKECATPVCKLLIMSRLRFVGRYVLYDEIHPVHKSEACLVMRARDHGLEDEYKRIMQFYDAKELEVEDDISDAGSEAPEPANNDRPNGVTMATFLGFAGKLGVQAKAARNEITKLMQSDPTSRPIETRENVSDKATGPEVHRVSDDDDDESYNSDDDLSVEFNTKPEPEDDDERDISKEAFSTFCRAHRLAESGVRTVVIKFMKTSKQFHREKDVRKPLDLSGSKWSVVPIFDDFNVDRIRESRKRDIHTISYRDDMAEDAIAGAPESKDELYALDIQEKNASVHNFALYKYAVVMPAGDRDLGEICQHEELGILQIREYMIQIGAALQCLHDQSTIHGDLKMENVVRFGKSLALIDFDGACHFGPKGKGEKMGGGSSKFCTGILPPEMIYRIDLISEYQKLMLYEDYWRCVSEDAKDLNLLTPDDIETITSVTKSLLAKAEVNRNLGKASNGIKTLRDEMNDIYGGLENRNDWKDILSISLITISFEDLPFSLNRCDGVEEFSDVWNRLIFHSKLWKRVKPRITADEKYAFLIKTYNDIPDEFGVVEKPAANQIPYALVDPSARIDIWGFGILLYTLCAGSSLFHLGFDGDLCYVSNFTDLNEWNKQKSERAIHEKIEDPLAQDLLLQILVPAPDRLRSMAEVLRHPFFGSPLNLEAQRILEKHEEQQLIIEETVVINRMTVETRRKVERSMERQCKIIFDEDKIVVPTCLVILPYKLEFDSSLAGNRVVIRSDENLGAAVKIGCYHLEIMKASARLSFWLAIKNHVLKDNKGVLKTRLKTWQKESRSRSPEDVADSILKEIGCGPEYMALCVEMLNDGESVSHSKDFVSDPLTAARRAIEHSTFALTSLYATEQYLYLIDEINGVPVCTDHLTADGTDKMTKAYPIRIDPTTSYLPNLFIPFMSLSVMKLTANGGLSALANLLGLPPSYGVPRTWNDGIPGLVHKAERPSTIAEFFVLQDMFRKQQRAAMGSDPRLSDDEVEKVGGEMRHLEDFFRDFDPIRTFSNLHRVSDGKEGSSAIWTTESEVSRIQGELELASAEYQLRELKKEWIKKQEIQKAIHVLQKQVDALRGGTMGISTPLHKLQSTNSLATPHSQANGKMHAYLNMPDYPNKPTPPSRTDIIFDPEQAAFDAKVQRERKRPQRKFRPYFGVC